MQCAAPASISLRRLSNEVATLICPLGLVSHTMSKRLLGKLSREVGTLCHPVPERGPEPVRRHMAEPYSLLGLADDQDLD